MSGPQFWTRDSYLEAYEDGQWDALAFLRGHVEDESPFVAVCTPCTADYALWMLGLNLTVAGALKSAELKGKATARSWNDGWEYRERTWKPERVAGVRDFNEKATPSGILPWIPVRVDK